MTRALSFAQRGGAATTWGWLETKIFSWLGVVEKRRGRSGLVIVTEAATPLHGDLVPYQIGDVVLHRR